MSPEDHRDPAGAPRPGQFYVPAPGGTPDPPPPRQARIAPKPSGPPQQGQDPSVRRPSDPPRNRQKPSAPTPPHRKPPRRSPAAPKEPKRPRGRRRGLKLALVVVPVLLLVLLGWFAVRALAAYRSIERVDLAGVLDPVTGDHVNYLLVGSDSREGFDPDVAPGQESTVTGRRSDTIILLRVGPEGATMMSVPRDLYVTIAGTGEQARINGAYNGGPARLVQTVQDNLDVPVNHYMEVGFASFAGMVDAIGGVTVEFPNPAFDEKSGLYVDQSGPVTLDGRQALAYVRSRNYTEVVNGQEVTDPTADLGRQERQQQFLRTALGDVGSTRNPFELMGAGEALSEGLVVDDSLGFGEMLGLVRKLGGSDPATVVLPTVPATRGGASVLLLQEPEAQQVLAGFR